MNNFLLFLLQTEVKPSFPPSFSDAIDLDESLLLTCTCVVIVTPQWLFMLCFTWLRGLALLACMLSPSHDVCAGAELFIMPSSTSWLMILTMSFFFLSWETEACIAANPHLQLWLYMLIIV